MYAVAIIGLGPFQQHIPDNCERWGLANGHILDCDLFFEIHEDFLDHPSAYNGNDIIERLNDIDAPILMSKPCKDVPKSLEYPLERIVSEFGNYLECSISYMVAFAIDQKADSIFLFGVSGDDGYRSQRPNIEYLLGFARGCGINVHVDVNSKLLTSDWPKGLYGLGGQNGDNIL